MNQPTKFLKLLSVGLAVLSIASFTTPALALSSANQAALSSTASQAAQKAKGVAFCTGLSAAASTLTTKLSDLQTKLTTTQTQRTTKIADRRTATDQAIASARSKADQSRQSAYATLQGKAKTDAQKTAVTTYEATITDAVSTRRSANDSARTTYRTAVDGLLSDNTNAVNGQVTTFISSVTTAISDATTSCQTDSANGSQIHTTFQAALKSAKDTFQSTRANNPKLSDQIKALAQTRDTGIKTNDAAFQATASTARQTLQSALK